MYLLVIVIVMYVKNYFRIGLFVIVSIYFNVRVFVDLLRLVDLDEVWLGSFALVVFGFKV